VVFVVADSSEGVDLVDDEWDGGQGHENSVIEAVAIGRCGTGDERDGGEDVANPFERGRREGDCGEDRY